MVTDVYSHILDEDRKKNAELFEEAFYEKKKSGSADASEYSRKYSGGSERRGCRTACKGSLQSGDGSASYFTGEDDEVKNSEKIV